MNNDTRINEFGFRELINKPTEEDLKEYYSKKYYQENHGHYYKTYTSEELTFLHNRITQKFIAICEIDPGFESLKGRMMDIGCGEGYTLDFFRKKGWEIMGIDYSDFGCTQCNPECVPYLMQGDVMEKMKSLLHAGEKYDIIWLDNVLEHALDPLALLTLCSGLMKKNGILVIEVPNDYSNLQKLLLETKKIENEFWVAIPDHISYFNLEGLKNLAKAASLQSEMDLCDFPIDIALLNPDTNYISDKTKGKNVHKARVELENLLHGISPEKTIQLLRSFAGLGFGRQIISFFKKM